MYQVIERQYNPISIITINSKRMEQSLDKIKQLDLAKKSKIKLIRGHLSFGLHEFFPNTCTYITILRDPIDRIISHYYFVLNNPLHYLHKKVKKHNMNLRDYVCSGISTELDNAQTRLLAGHLSGTQNVSLDIGFGKCTTKMLNLAIDNLEKYFPVVGLADRFDETLVQLKRYLGWKHIYYNKMRVSKKRLAKERLPNNVLKSIEKYNNLDIELYNYAKTIFDDQIKKQNKSFFMELEEFQKHNKRFGKLLYISTFPLSAFHKILRAARQY